VPMSEVIAIGVEGSEPRQRKRRQLTILCGARQGVERLKSLYERSL